MKKVGEGYILSKVVTKNLSEEITFKLRPEWRKATNFPPKQIACEVREKRTPKETVDAKALRQKWGWCIWGTERKLGWLSKKGRKCGRLGKEVGNARLGFYLNAVGSQCKVLVSSRLSNLGKYSVGLLTCKRVTPLLFIASPREIDSPSWVSPVCGPQGCNFQAGCSPP